MSIKRMFLNWNQPALPQVADYLLGQYRSLDTVDLSAVVIVFPGRRAGRRLREILVDAASEKSVRLIPPAECTVGSLPELLYEPKLPFASEMVQKMAWAHALRSLESETLKQIIPQIPESEDPVRWKELGDLFWRQHRELAADGIDFAHVAEHGNRLQEFDETGRWRVMRQVQETYLHTLDELKLWDRQTARLFAIEHNECQTDKDIVLVGTVDMNMATRQMIDQVADHVTALIHASDDLADHFDHHGCLLPQRWEEFKLQLSTENVHVVDSPVDQAKMVARCMAGFDGQYRADEIGIGMPDHALVPQVQRQLGECGISSRWVVGATIDETGPYRCINALLAWLINGQSKEFAALVRHPDVETWLRANGAAESYLFELDEYMASHLQPQLGNWLQADEKITELKKAYSLVEELVASLKEPAQFLDQWAAVIRETLMTIYGQRSIDSDDWDDEVTLEACRHICNVLNELGQISADLVGKASANDALRFVLDYLQNQMIPSPPDDQALELLGWLELPLDDAPAVIVTSFNEGHVPTSVNSDLFLPNRLRKHLGVIDNQRRYARDAYALAALLASRETVQLVVGRRSAQGDPLTPSRLLFATEPENIAQRVLDFYESAESDNVNLPPIPDVWQTTRDRSLFEVPFPTLTKEPLTTLRVTAFKTYLVCPYRFYLQHVLKLKAIDATAVELNALGFGNLIHEVLSEFGESDVRDATDEAKVENFLNRSLDDIVYRWYGKNRLAAVNVQVEQMRRRLMAFARWQAAWANEGWEIKHTEVAAQNHDVSIASKSGSILLSGRIDRIDFNSRSGEWRVFDYKSSASANSPAKIHQEKGEWVDLQLPLYRQIAKALGIGEQVGLGYIVLPKDVSKVGNLDANWSGEELEKADVVATNVVENVLQQNYWPPTEPPPKFSEDFSPICQDRAFEKVWPEPAGGRV